MHLLGDPQAVGHLDDVDPVDEGLVVLVVLEALPFGFVRVRKYHAFEGYRADGFGAVVVALLRRGQQRVQHLDRRLEHLDEFHQPLVGLAQAAREAVGVGVVLFEFVQAPDVHLANQ